MAEEPKPIVAHTKHGDLSLDQIAELMPGFGALMREISDRYWTAYYAAQGGNWALAAYMLRGVRKRLNEGSITRPKYKAMNDDYISRIIEPLLKCCEARDFAGFEQAYQAGIELANKLHVATKHPEIVWKLPATPPAHLDLKSPS
jgi:hypothetical protein